MSAVNPPPRTSYARGRAQRQRIIETATEVFGQLGYNKSSMLEIAARCQLTRAGIAHHFPTKESLLEGVLAWRDEEDRARFKANGSQRGDGIGVLRGMIDLTVHNSTVPGLIGLYVVVSAEASAPEHPAHAYFADRYERIRSGTRWALVRARESGYLSADIDIPSFAVEITALMDGVQLQWLFAPDAIDMRAQLSRFLQRALTVPL